MSNITNISIEVLKIHPRNQEFFDDISGEDYERFKTSISEDGVITPLIVAPDMTIISGHQRTKACLDLGIKKIPVIIREDIEDEDEKLKLLLATNFGRTKNDPAKQRKIMTQYVELCGLRNGEKNQLVGNRLPLKEIAKVFGVSETVLKENLIIERKLTPELKELLDEGKITKSTAHRILARLSPEEQKEVLEDLGIDGLSEKTQAQLKEYVSKLQQKEKENEQLKKALEEEKSKPKEKEVIIEEDIATKEELKLEREHKVKLLRELESLRKQVIENQKVAIPQDTKKTEELESKIKRLEIDLKYKDELIKNKEDIIKNKEELIKSKLEGTDNDKELMELYKDRFDKYNKIIGTTCDYQSNGEDLGRKMGAGIDMANFLVSVENLLKEELAPLKYERCLRDIGDNEIVKKNVNELLELVKNWHDEIYELVNGETVIIQNDSIIDCEIIH